MDEDLVVIVGGGGFIGGHIAAQLRAQGRRNIRVVDIRPEAQWWQRFAEFDNRSLDLGKIENCLAAVAGASEVYNFAADMGGMGFIESNKALCMLSVLINTHLLLACREAGVERYFFASSACVYAADKQNCADVAGLREEEVYPAMPEDGYGWEKLFSERMCRHFMEDFGIEARIARYHNVYGPHGTWDGGREKAPAALCRKVIQAKLSGELEIEIWGDGSQTRSFTYIDDAAAGTLMLMESDVQEPLNIGSAELVSINQLVDVLEEIAGVQLRRRYLTDAPLGVNGRNSDNTRIERLLGWSPGIRLCHGMEKTYAWIYDQVNTRSHLANYNPAAAARLSGAGCGRCQQ